MHIRPRAAVLAAALVWLLAALPAAAQYLRLYYPDIEQGSSTVVVSPTGHALVMDAGTGADPTDDDIVLVLEDLVRTGVVTSIDYVVSSHYHEDHIGRMDDVLNFGPVSPATIAYDRGLFGGVPTSFAYLDYADAAAAHGRTTITPGTVLDLGGGVTAECVVVAGQTPDGSAVDVIGAQQFENAASIGLVVHFGDFDAWIGGDLTGNVDLGFTDVESAAAPFAGDVDVYTFNHHGSHSSSTVGFLAALKAEVGIAQMGASNNFGHPNIEAVQRFLATPDTFNQTPLFFQQNPGNPTDARSDDSLATGIADPDDIDGPGGLPGTLTLFSDGTSYELFGGDVGPVLRPADHGLGTLGTFPPAVLRVSRSPLVPRATETVGVDAAISGQGAFSAEVAWSLDGVDQAPIPMTAGAGGVYHADLPATPDGARVAFRVRTTDAGGRVGLSPRSGYYSGTTPIARLRGTDAGGLLLDRGFLARVEGTITAEPGVFHPFVSQIYVQDDAGSALQVFAGSLLPLARGDRAEFVGSLEQFGGQLELNISQSFGNIGSTRLGAGTLPAPLVVTLSQLLASAEALEGVLVRVDGLEVVSGTIPETGNGNLTVTDDGGATTLTLHVDGDTDVPGANTPTQPFSLVGIASQFDSSYPFTGGYQIVPRSRGDFLTDEVNLPPLVINEIHADPDATLGDANGDGTRSASDDEFVELANTTDAPLDISGWTVADTVGVRHVFAAGTVLPAGEVTVVFGGGTPTGAFGNATALGLVFTASTGSLSLNNTGDTITVADAAGALVQQVSYGSEGGNNQSLVRDPDASDAPFVLHSTATGSGGSLYSPGTRTDGQFFRVPVGAVVLSEVLYDPAGADGGLEWVELFNATSQPIDLSALSLGAGGSDYTSSVTQLSGTIQPGATFVVGGPTSSADNANPVFDQVADFTPDLQNAGTLADGVALFNVRASRVGPTTVPIDAVVYGGANDNGLIDETGVAHAPDVADAPSGSSIERVDLAGVWQVQAAPGPGTTPLVAGGGGGGGTGGGGGSGAALVLSEVFYDASGSDSGLEWVEIYNPGSTAVDLSGWSLGNGGSDYTYSTLQLTGTIGPGATFVVGGPLSGVSNANPVFDQAVDFSPDFQNGGSTADGVALFDVPAASITASTVPVDAVVYGTTNSSGLIDETGTAAAPDVGSASPGSSLERLDLAGTWQVQSAPNPGATPLP